MKIIEDFKKFAIRGNVLDLAVAVVIGAAFGKIVSSLVDNIIMPTIGVLTGGINLSNFNIKVGDAVIAYGLFLQAIINFLIISFSIFIVVKQLDRFKKKEEIIAKVPSLSKEEVLLTEIRDELRKKENN